MLESLFEPEAIPDFCMHVDHVRQRLANAYDIYHISHMLQQIWGQTK